MSFDIHQDLFANDDYPEDAVEAYRDELVDRFYASPEGQALFEEVERGGFAGLLIDYGMSYHQVTPATMSPGIFELVLFSLFPRKVSMPPEEAPEAIAELSAFCRFLAREYGLDNARECLEVLGDGAETRLARELANPANFGMAKAFFSEGQARGFDLSNEEGLQQWVRAANAGGHQPVAVNPVPAPRALTHAPSSKKTQKARAKRKLQRKSRKQNRKRR